MVVHSYCWVFNICILHIQLINVVVRCFLFHGPLPTEDIKFSAYSTAGIFHGDILKIFGSEVQVLPVLCIETFSDHVSRLYKCYRAVF
jgi:hypothetical protein